MHPSREDSFLPAAVDPRSGRCAPANVMPGVAAMRTACYSAENRMISETDANGTTATYAYDGNGHRDQGLERVDDHLGSTRLLTKADGIVVIYDCSPFGMEFAQSGDTKVSGNAVRNSWSTRLPQMSRAISEPTGIPSEVSPYPNPSSKTNKAKRAETTATTTCESVATKSRTSLILEPV